MLTKLIQISSISVQEEEIQKYIADFLTSCGYKPFWIKGNVVLQIKGKNSQNCLIFNSHVDTVSPGDIKKWKYGPFEGKAIGDKIYGLGASDEKAAVATLLGLAKFYSCKEPECDIWLTFVIGEEVDGHGTEDFLNWFMSKYYKIYKNISGILGEPTGLGSIETAHKGNIFLKITTFGKSGHGSEQHKESDHAVLSMFKVVIKLNNLNKEWKSKYKDKTLGFPSIAPATSIAAGDISVPNKYPDSCTATFDTRTVPMMHGRALKEIVGSIKMIKDTKVELLYPPVGCGYTSTKSAIAKTFKKVVRKPFSVSKASNDMCFFTEKGIPAVVFGPGEAGVIHKPNEYCYPAKINKCVEIFKEVIKGYNDNCND